MLVAEGPVLAYELVEGRWAPVGDSRPLPAWLDDDAGPAFPRRAGA